MLFSFGDVVAGSALITRQAVQGCGRSVARDTPVFVALGVAELSAVSGCALSQAITGRASRDPWSFAACALWHGLRLWDLVTIALPGTNRMTFARGYFTSACVRFPSGFNVWRADRRVIPAREARRSYRATRRWLSLVRVSRAASSTSFPR